MSDQGPPAERWTPETEALVARARAEHHGTVIHLPGAPDRAYAWRCQCGGGRAVSDAIDWESAAAELHIHARRAALTALADAGLLVTPQTRAVLDAARAYPTEPAIQAAARARYNLDRQNGTDWWATAPIPEQAVELVKAEAALRAARDALNERP